MLNKILILSVLSFVGTENVRYDDYALYKVHIKSENDVKFLKELSETDKELDFWVEPRNSVEFVSVVTPPGKKNDFEHTLKKRSIHSDIILNNLQAAFDTQLYSRRKRDTNDQLHWTAYQTLEDINDWLNHLALTYPNVVSLVSAGLSYEGRNITGIKISKGNNNRAFLLEGGQVAADWLSPTVLTYIIEQLVKGEDPEARAAAEQFEWHIFPSMNPDGFEYSENAVRLWVKNRRPQLFRQVGVDLTKNWNSQWGVSGGSHQPSANNYIGLGPFSEPETRSMSRYIESIGSRLSGFISFRTFGQRLTIPFAHASEPLYNYNDMITIGRRAMGSLAVKYNTQYLVGTSKEVLDGATGSVADWVKYRFNPPVVATYNLRDNGTFGYALPVNQVLPSCEETYDSLMAVLREAKFLGVL